MVIDFYEKRGCINNKKQKELLRKVGFNINEYDILATKWQEDTLREFFGDKPTHEWFNPSAPKVKNSEIDIENITQNEALEMMVNEPILIKRPLIKVNTLKLSGFDKEKLSEYLKVDIMKEETQICINSCS